jgi:diamine N-acetyltransferase
MIAYRAPAAGEAEALAALARETFDEAFGALYKPTDLAVFYAEWKTPDAFAGWIADPRVHLRVACDDGAPIAYAMVGLDSKLDYDPAPRTAVELKQLYVRSGYHGAGVAHTLMAWVIDEARTANADEIVLSVYSGNPRGQAFYAKHGFTKVADTVFIVGEQVDEEFLFVKPLRT